ncbi:MAG TPA: SDR family oxidoreductase [Gemmatimonadaceae bacterium]|nr:SDR family oxidoreductase [Gemmatimonadaceae bacterium]
MDLALRGKIALVTAASKGLGRAIAAELAVEGATVVMCARGKEELSRAAAGIRNATSAEVLDVPADVSRSEDVDRLVRTTVEQYGRIDILVTNAGGPPSGPFESLDAAKWDEAIKLTLLSTVNLCRAVIPGMKERRWGRIINVTSIAVKQPIDGLMLSNSLRAGVTGFARTLANEVARDGITVNNILPGYTRTERVESLARAAADRDGTPVDESLKRWEREIPMGRLGEPREFAALAAFLASQRASYITGTSIAVDGGWTRSIL